LFFHLDNFKENEKDLSEETKQVSNVLKEKAVNWEFKQERDEETDEIEIEHSLKENFDGQKLEINDFPHNF